MKIIVTGSLGNISRSLTQQLVQKGYTVTVISSNAERQKDIEALGATAAIGKLEEEHFLTNSFANADAAYCMIPFNFNEKDQSKYFQTIVNNYILAIKYNGIKKVVFLTGWAADVISSINVNDLFAQFSDLSFTELRPSVFYTNFYGYIDMIKESGSIMANYGGEDQLAFVSPKDIAAAAVEELTAVFGGKKIRYVASEELTCNEAASILGKAIGKPDLKWMLLPDEQMRDGLIKSGFSPELANNLLAMQAKMHSGEIYENYLLHKPVLGKIKLEDFAKEFAKVYNQN